MAKIASPRTALTASLAVGGSSPSRNGAEQREAGDDLDARPPQHRRVDPQLSVRYWAIEPPSSSANPMRWA